MSPRVLFFFGLAMLAVAMVNASCPCGGGVDVCSCTPMVVRPPKVPRPMPVPRVICAKFNPPKYESSDPCCCKNNYVGIPPRPAPRCPSCRREPVCDCDPQVIHNTPVHTIPFSHSDLVADIPEYVDDDCDKQTGVSCGNQMINAADPVSLHLAYAASLNRPVNVKEGALSYGFSKTPEYQPIKKEVMNIPEEKIAVVDKKILELRLPTATSDFDPEEEVVTETDEEFGSSDPAGLSYADIGYIPEKGKPCAWKPAVRPSCGRPSVVYVSDPAVSYSSEGDYESDGGLVEVDSGEVRYGSCGKCNTCGNPCRGPCPTCSSY